ncbi:Carboxylesterase 1 [Gammaproteobacteria bacterium]
MIDGYLPTVEIDAEGVFTAAVIWMHGLGADGYDFVDIVPDLGLTPRGVRFIFPHAPHRSITINHGYVMRAWYDVRTAEFTEREDRAGLDSSRESIEVLIRREAERGIPPNRIVLAGFSQGGAVALHTLLQNRLAGVLALSTYLPLAHSAASEVTLEDNRTPVLMMHGIKDTVIPITLGRSSRQQLETMGYPVQWLEYPMGHEVSIEQIEVIRTFLRKVLDF